MLVAHNRDATQKQLSQALAVSAPNVTALIDRMNERELLKRVRNETDRRSQHVRLTRKGAALVREVREVSLTMERDLLRHLSDAERGDADRVAAEGGARLARLTGASSAPRVWKVPIKPETMERAA